MLRRATAGKRRPATVDTQLWVEMLEAAGMDDAAKKRWHMEFERRAPEGHQEFLLTLGILQGEVARIRSWSRGEIEDYELPENAQLTSAHSLERKNHPRRQPGGSI
jgi:hypothetical protein